MRPPNAFFDLPAEAKRRVARPRPDQNRGYIGYGEETLARLGGRETPPDYKEIFSIGPFDLPDDTYYTAPAAYPSFAPNLWPAEPPELQPAMRAYWQRSPALARRVLGICALALGLPCRLLRRRDRPADQHAASDLLSALRPARRKKASCAPACTPTSTC